jgi:putative addiction module killer protein
VLKLFRTATFKAWLSQLRDKQAVLRIQARIARLEQGNPGDVRPVGQGISEMRIAYGPGYRLYYLQTDFVIIVLFCGGDKSSQDRDIAQAKLIAAQWKE